MAVLFAMPKSPPAPDATFYGRALYDLAYAMTCTAGGSPDYGDPLRFVRRTDNGGETQTFYHLEDQPLDVQTERP